MSIVQIKNDGFHAIILYSKLFHQCETHWYEWWLSTHHAVPHTLTLFIFKKKHLRTNSNWEYIKSTQCPHLNGVRVSLFLWFPHSETQLCNKTWTLNHSDLWEASPSPAHANSDKDWLRGRLNGVNGGCLSYTISLL